MESRPGGRAPPQAQHRRRQPSRAACIDAPSRFRPMTTTRFSRGSSAQAEPSVISYSSCTAFPAGSAGWVWQGRGLSDTLGVAWGGGGPRPRPRSSLRRRYRSESVHRTRGIRGPPHLEHVLPATPLHVEEALHPEDVPRRLILLPKDPIQPALEPLQVHMTGRPEADSADPAVVHVVAAPLGARGALDGLCPVVGLDAEDLPEVDAAPRGAEDARSRVDRQYLLPQGEELPLAHQIHLVDHYDIRVGDLLLRLVHRSARAALLHLPADVVGVHHGHNRIEAHARLQLGVRPQSRRHRPRVREACGLDEDVVKLVPLAHQRLERLHEVVLDAAAEAAVAELDPLLHHRLRLPGLRLLHQRALDPDLGAELVHDDRDPVAVRCGEYVVDQRGLARSQVACDQGDRHRLMVMLLGRSLLGLLVDWWRGLNRLDVIPRDWDCLWSLLFVTAVTFLF
mmetsp:Transcript_16881/g.40240  ORF Transcript_16881/g.40240 Transcript_16881/m.40240 type:complete len:453 (+) Transcript_16881:358-1716(+)